MVFFIFVPLLMRYKAEPHSTPLSGRSLATASVSSTILFVSVQFLFSQREESTVLGDSRRIVKSFRLLLPFAKAGWGGADAIHPTQPTLRGSKRGT
jgi:hypothetical protein